MSREQMLDFSSGLWGKRVEWPLYVKDIVPAYVNSYSFYGSR